MSNRFRADLIKLGVFVVVAVLITVSVVATLLDLKLGQPSTGYHAIFANASGLESGDTVRIAGVEVGKVNGVGLVGDKAKVDFTVASSNHLTTSSTASIQFENLLGQRYLQISAGAPGGSPLHSGATIPMAQTQPGLDLTTVFSGFQPLLAALDPKQVNDLTGSIIAVLQGESGSVANLVNQTAVLTDNLASRQSVIDQILDNLTPLLTSVNWQDSQLGNLIDGLDSLVNGLAGQRRQIGDAVTGLSNLTVNATNLLQNVQPTLDQDLSGLQSVTSELLANQPQLSAVIADLPALLNSLDKVTSSGNYLAVYICDLTLNVSGPISVKLSPTVPQSPPLTVPSGAIGDQSQKTSVCA
ncbi:MAG TPA: MlaD family protein [Acidimicrobiales bacterium]|nr:MlaD family protein [Acidimicrobiales bacterium]